MMEGGFPQHLVRVVQSLHYETQVVVEREGERWKKKSICKTRILLSPTLFNFYIKGVLKRRQVEMKGKFHVNNSEFNTPYFADDKAIIADSKDYLKTRYINIIRYNSKYYNMGIFKARKKCFPSDGRILQE
jgi:hypothetical protein